MDRLDLAWRIGVQILDREHLSCREYVEDDSEYIPRLKRLITSISKATMMDGVKRENGEQLERRLYVYARNLYSETWIVNAEEQEGPGNFNPQNELQLAHKTFDEYYIV